MIPKIIHYCWFGGGEKDELTKKCIESWKRFCPDYTIKEWNESNYDITKNQYMNEAYQKKRWGFVSDYARLDIINENGGIYLDTDVEMIKSFDDLLSFNSFFGFEKTQNGFMVNTGSGFGAVKGNEIVMQMKKYYDNKSFINEDGSLNLLTCPHANSKVLVQNGFEMNNQSQNIEENILFPYDYFSPFYWAKKKGKITSNTYSIHYYNASWVSKEEKKKRRRERRIDYVQHLPNRVIKSIIGEKRYECLKSKLRGRRVK